MLRFEPGEGEPGVSFLCSRIGTAAPLREFVEVLPFAPNADALTAGPPVPGDLPALAVAVRRAARRPRSVQVALDSSCSSDLAVPVRGS
jgi:hypothetical protein